MKDGLGLGLAPIEQPVEQQDGTISPGGGELDFGSRFLGRLPSVG